MTHNHRRLIQLLVRFDNAYEEIEERHADAYDIDSLVDGGEFSGRAHADAVIKEADAVARRLGFASACLIDRIACQLNVPRVSNPWR